MGLKQAAREWNNNINTTLKHLGFYKLVSEPCIYIKKKDNKLLFVIGVYVDDLLITGKDDEIKINKIVRLIKEKYSVTDIGKANFIIGVTNGTGLLKLMDV